MKMTGFPCHLVTDQYRCHNAHPYLRGPYLTPPFHIWRYSLRITKFNSFCKSYYKLISLVITTVTQEAVYCIVNAFDKIVTLGKSLSEVYKSCL